MSEENNTSQENNISETVSVEQEARAQGWVPKEEFKGDPDHWFDAGEFLRRGELFNKIESQKQSLKKLDRETQFLKQALQEMRKHHESVREIEYKRALEDLKRQKKEALVEGDADAVIEIDEKIDLVREEKANLERTKQETAPEVPVSNPVFDSWRERNAWYDSSRAMKAFADTLGVELASQGHSPTEVLKMVEEEVKREFPHKFSNPNREKPGSVLPPGNSKNRSTKDDFVMSEEERKIMDRFVRSGALTEEQYKADLKKIKGMA